MAVLILPTHAELADEFVRIEGLARIEHGPQGGEVPMSGKEVLAVRERQGPATRLRTKAAEAAKGVLSGTGAPAGKT
jgi:hypothetical protein